MLCCPTEKDPLKDSEAPTRSGGQFKKLNWLKAGILASDRVLTVSPNYAQEISSDASGGVELDTYIRQKVRAKQELAMITCLVSFPRMAGACVACVCVRASRA